MHNRSAVSVTFSTREHRRLQRLYRTRELAQTRRKSKTNSNAKGVTFFTVYGSRGRLSPSQRTLFREQLNSSETFKNVSVKLSLFSTSVSQAVRSCSSLREVRSLLKGPSYQMTFQTSSRVPSAVSDFNLDVVDINAQEGNYALYSKITPFLNHLKTVRFSEESSREFAPFLFFFPSFWSTQAPRRYKQLNQLSNKFFSKTRLIFAQSGLLNSSTVSVFSYILFMVDKKGKHSTK